MTPLARLRAVSSPSEFAGLLGYKPSALSYIIYKMPRDTRYFNFSIAKKSGGLREISAPNERLKKLQQRLALYLNACYEEIHSNKNLKNSLSHGFRRNHSIITNSSKHIKKRYVFNLDLKDFFPSINFGRVRGFFLKDKNFQLNESISTVIAQIACYNGVLPQGSPTSPVISNLIGNILDVRLVAFSKECKCTYSRYADDITFSTNDKNFPKSIAYFDSEEDKVWKVAAPLRKAIARCDFRVNDEKVSMQYAVARQVVTGLVVNKKVNVKSEYYRKARAMCWSLINKDRFFIENQAVDGTLSQIEGILSYILHVKKPRIPKRLGTPKDKPTTKDEPTSLVKLYRKYLFYKYFYQSSKPIIVCEGATDPIYLKAAIFALKDSFPLLFSRDDGLEISFLRFSENFRNVMGVSTGASGLSSLIDIHRDILKDRSFKPKPPKNPVIIVLDNDSGADSIFSRLNSQNKDLAKDRNKEFYLFRENLYIVCTPRPDDKKQTCIENLFDKETLETKVDGKTFNPSDDRDNATEYSKMVFANKVVRSGRKTIDFTGFTDLLSRISKVVEQYAKIANKS